MAFNLGRIWVLSIRWLLYNMRSVMFYRRLCESGPAGKNDTGSVMHTHWTSEHGFRHFCIDFYLISCLARHGTDATCMNLWLVTATHIWHAQLNLFSQENTKVQMGCVELSRHLILLMRSQKKASVDGNLVCRSHWREPHFTLIHFGAPSLGSRDLCSG